MILKVKDGILESKHRDHRIAKANFSMWFSEHYNISMHARGVASFSIICRPG